MLWVDPRDVDRFLTAQPLSIEVSSCNVYIAMTLKPNLENVG